MSAPAHPYAPLVSSFRRLLEIAFQQPLPEPAKLWRPASAQAFAERLILVLDDPSAAALVREHPAEATAFLELGVLILRQVVTGQTTPRTEPSGPILPYYLLCALVLDYCARIREIDPELYQDA